MPYLYGRQYSREELLERVGDISQLAGVRRVLLDDGNERGARAIEIQTGTGFSFTVLADRGFDISAAAYQGQSLAWRSNTGDVAPAYFEPQGMGWLRGFFGGLLTTCGLSHLGSPCQDDGEDLGLHGRISYTPARNVQADSEWQGNEYCMWAQGKLWDASALAPRLTLIRRIRTALGSNRCYVRDHIENEGHRDSPLMLLYHWNFGFPLLDSNTRLLVPSTEVKSLDGSIVTTKERYQCFSDPQPTATAEIFHHEAKAGKDGYVRIALVNSKLNSGQGLGVYIRYRQRELPHLWQWKMQQQGAYIAALEPSNCWLENRNEARKNNRLPVLKAGESVEIEMEFGVLTSHQEIEQFARALADEHGTNDQR